MAEQQNGSMRPSVGMGDDVPTSSCALRGLTCSFGVWREKKAPSIGGSAREVEI